MYRIIWATEAKQDFRRVRDFLHGENPIAARKIHPAIAKATQLISDNPNIGSALQGDSLRRRVWRVSVGRAQYVLYYIPDHAQRIIRILRIWHSREDRESKN